jgi:hypothetical protein
MMPTSGRASTNGRRSSGRWWRRLFVATIAAYLAAYVVEATLGLSDPTRVGWSRSYLPVIVEGGVFGLAMGGVWGVLLAPLPLLLTPETWVRIRTLWNLVGPAGLAILVQPLPPMWGAAIVGALIRRALSPLSRR